MPLRALKALRNLAAYAADNTRKTTQEKVFKNIPILIMAVPTLAPSKKEEDLEQNVMKALDTVTIDEMRR
jgi:UDP-N-acetyl-D-mannosaminuronate dehydrogenase